MACETNVRLLMADVNERQENRPMFLVSLDFWIVHLATNQTFGVKDSVFRVGMESVLGGVADTARMSALSEA